LTKPLIDRLPPSFKTPMAKFVAGSILITGVIAMAFNHAAKQDPNIQEVSYSQFKKMVGEKSFTLIERQEDSESKQVTYVGRNGDSKVRVITRDFPDPALAMAAESAGAEVKSTVIETPAWWKGALLWFLPSVLFLGVLIAWQNNRDKKQAQAMGQAKGGTMTFGKSKAKLHEDVGARKTTFADVAGVDEAKNEVSELVEFLKNPEKFKKMGARLPRGLLMSGGPGLGKTLLAKAIAGEAKVPFYSIAGSDFVEMFVGVGAARVRDMFEQIRKQGRCILFIDEIDSMGRARGGANSNDERESTLNQMLVEMDGFDDNSAVLIIAATNRPDILDPALLRPGRFDRQVTLNLPDAKGRHQILKVHAKGKPIARNVRLGELAQELEGSSGADIANLLNEAALRAALRDSKDIQRADINYALEKIALGPARDMTVDPDDERCTAYHEAGHAITAYRLEKICHVRVNKVSVTPRGRALGVTWTVSDKDSPSKFKDNLQGHIAYLQGGRVAEIMKYQQPTTGASNDLERITDTARRMVMVFGMAKDLPARNYAPVSASGHHNPPMSSDMAARVESAINDFVNRGEEMAAKALEDNAVQLELMAEALLEYKTLEREDIVCIMEEKSLEKLKEIRARRDAEFMVSVAKEESQAVPVIPPNPNLWVSNNPV